MSTIVKISEKGQLVIPKKIRDNIGLSNGGSVNIVERDGVIVIRKTKNIFDIAGTINVSEDFDTEKALQEAQQRIADEKNSY